MGGRVQGVGFRPFVYRMAKRWQVRGWVRNRAGEVEILAQGPLDALRRFGDTLLTEAPPLARPEIFSEQPAEPELLDAFEIRESTAAQTEHIHVPPDYFACAGCLAELADPNDRRFRYPFINCTQCGPRYTLIERLPYDRANTAMAGFALCPRCAADYGDPLDRRFHAEPVACAECGPHLEFHAPQRSDCRGEDALAACLIALRAGEVVAVKGIGGYHLICDAANSPAVASLRARKQRPHKPLAVMFPLEPDLAALRRAVLPQATHEALLLDPIRPIVLIPKNPASDLAPEIAPDCGEIGAMLPYSPLHHLLLADFGRPFVATSGNISGEPVLTDNVTAQRRLAPVADAFLHHNRPIVRPADDPVYRVIAGKPRPIRLGRGNAPLEMALPFRIARPLLALGGHLKNTVALAWGERAVVSPHLADMDSPRSVALLQQVAGDLQALYGVKAETVLCDAHPRYTTTRLAKEWGLPLAQVFHHHAHASALAGEFQQTGDWLVFAWDGAGYGEDGTIWGGEALLGRPGRWRRVASWRPFALLGGDRAAREPARIAHALCWEAGTSWSAGAGDSELLRQAWERGLNRPLTSSIGRLFDAAAAFLGLCLRASFEGQAPMHVEAACGGESESLPLPLHKRDGLWISDWEPLLAPLQDPQRSVASRASLLHTTLARALIAQASALRAEHGISRIGLAGGVFQNRVLCEKIAGMAARENFELFIPERLPCNDAGLSFGQLIEASVSA